MAVEITVYNMSVKIETTDFTLVKHINDFLSRNYTDSGMSFNKNADQSQTKKVFVSKLKDYNTFFMHINQFREFREYLGNMGYSPQITKKIDATLTSVVGAEMNLQPQWVLRDEQKPVVDFIVSNYHNKKKTTLVPIQMGKGKSQPYRSMIKTPEGWTTMGEVYVGQKVTTPTGRIETVTGVFPQGYTDVYTVIFEDGRSTQCSGDHLWDIVREKTIEVVTTFDIMERLAVEDIYIPTVMGSVYSPDVGECEEKTVIDPRCLGSLLRSLPPDKTYELELVTGESLDTLHIPEKYMNGNLISTQNLLTGLGLDLDTVSEKVYRSHNNIILHQVNYLLRSIGFVSYVEGDCVKYRWSSVLKIKEIVYRGVELTKCISITSSEDWDKFTYITDDFIVTHNTFVSLCALSMIKKRVGVLILPMYIKKWVPDILNIHDTKSENICIVQGRTSLLETIEMARNGTLNFDYIVFSSTTMQEFINSYEENPEYTYQVFGIEPCELFSLLGIGVILIDETHQHLHSLYKTLIHTNVPYCLALSATPISENRVIKRVYNFLYPKENIYEGFVYDRYIDVYPMSYTIGSNNIRAVKTTEYGSNFYSHNAFEKSIMKHKNMLSNYFKVIVSTLETLYKAYYVEGDKLLIFTSTIDMATRLTNHLRGLYPNLIINRYCEKDPYHNLMESDIIVSTPISAGTAVDIKKLRVVILTVSISSIVSNLQILGRLRKQDLDVKFCYMYSANIPKQVEYHKKKKELFLTKVNSIREMHSPVQV